MIRFMTKQLALVSCDPLTPSPSSSRSNSAPPKLHIATCPPNIAGGFGPSDSGRPTSESGILICSNRVINKSHMEDTLAHEMIHWWDHCRFKVDWNDLKHHACSEVSGKGMSDSGLKRGRKVGNLGSESSESFRLTFASPLPL